jgi:hypothetical protein
VFAWLPLILAVAVTAPPCTVADAVLGDQLDSGSARVGQTVHFTLTDPASGDTLPGYGLVTFVRGARRAGYPGLLGIEARFVEHPDGTHVPATLVRLAGLPEDVVDGRTRDLPPVLAGIGAFHGPQFQIAAAVVGVYGGLHFGTQAVLARGTRLRIVLGDDYVTGACTVP